MNKNNPLVSVCIVTYNSADFLIETLNSVKQQTYKNVELIISDDCSSDLTLNIASEWISKNRSQFINANVYSLEFNSGVPTNCNNAIKRCNGEWIILLGGDDLLKKSAIDDYLHFISNHPSAEIIFSQYQYFLSGSEGNRFGHVRPNDVEIRTLQSSNSFQKEELLFSNYLPAPSYIIKRKLAQKYHFDENYRLFEDYPYWINLTYNDIRFYFMEKVTVFYRQHESTSHSNYKYVNESLLLENERLFFEKIYPYNLDNEALLRYKRAIFFIQEFEVIFLDNNRSNFFGKIILRYIRTALTKWAGRKVSF